MGIKCPKCNEGEFVKRGSMGKGRARKIRVFYGCSRYPDCDFTTPFMPMAEPCPKCGAPFIVEKKTKIGTVRACLKEGCDWEKLAAGREAGGETRGDTCGRAGAGRREGLSGRGESRDKVLTS